MENVIQLVDENSGKKYSVIGKSHKAGLRHSDTEGNFFLNKISVVRLA
jgi:hypothetical protein